MVGSSLLFVYDQGAVPGPAEESLLGWQQAGKEDLGAAGRTMGPPLGANVWMIDFAHTHPAPLSTAPLAHREPTHGSASATVAAMGGGINPPPGDGYLTGLDNLIIVWERALQQIAELTGSAPTHP